MIKAVDIKKKYGNLEVLKGVSLTIEPGEILAITGKSGAGKSTLLHIIGTLDQPDSGEIYFDNELINNYKGKELAKLRNSKIGFVFQFHHLLPEFSALENVMIPSFIAKKDRQTAEGKAEELLRYVGLADRITHKPNELSGGEQQRVAIARALINDPQVILADEPTGNLDTRTSEEIHELFLGLKATFNPAFVIVTHNLKLAKLCDRVLDMKDGLIQDTIF